VHERPLRASPAAFLALLASCATSRDDVIEFGPPQDLFRPYIADPRRARMGVTVIEVTDPSITGAGDSRFGLRAGERAGLVRVHERGEPNHGWQVDLEGGYNGTSDRDQAEDVIGWDGVYGLQVAWRKNGSGSWRSGVFHTSSHLGDEFEDLTTDNRNLTREDLYLAYSRDLTAAWRGYLELGYAVHMSDEGDLEPGRAQAGLEYEPKPQWANGRLGWFSALDTSSFQEDEWKVNLNWQTGLVWPVHNAHTAWRVGIEVYHGRSTMGEFIEERETWIALGLWL
jgi:hypothetical protein